jgi:predicted kinase
MLFLIGGASRAGKSIVARWLMHSHGVPYFSLDLLATGLADGLPALGVDPARPSRETAERLWPVVRAMAAHMLEAGVDYTLEGGFVLPEHVAELARQSGSHVRACFLGYAEAAPQDKVAAIRTFSNHANDRLAAAPDDDVLARVEAMIAFSRELRAECERSGLAYVETSGDFPAALERAVTLLGP